MEEHDFGKNKPRDVEYALSKRNSRRHYAFDKKISHSLLESIIGDCTLPSHFGESSTIWIIDAEKALDSGHDPIKGLYFNWINIVAQGGKENLAKTAFRSLVGSHKSEKEKNLPPHYLVCAMEDSHRYRSEDTAFGRYEVNYSLVGMAAGFHNRLLHTTAEGIDSCIHGVLNERVYKNILSLGEEVSIPLVSPLGYSPQEHTYWEKKVRGICHAEVRKSPTDILFDCDCGSVNEAEEELNSLLSWVIKGPSAGNGQPWRFYQDGQALHLAVSLEGKRIYRKNHLMEMDAGIAMETISMLSRGIWDIGAFKPKDDRQVYIATFERAAGR